MEITKPIRFKCVIYKGPTQSRLYTNDKLDTTINGMVTALRGIDKKIKFATDLANSLSAFLSLERTHRSSVVVDDPVEIAFKIIRTGITTNSVSAGWYVDGYGPNPAIVDDFNGVFPTGNVTFLSGETVKWITFTAYNNALGSVVATFSVTLNNPDNTDFRIPDTLTGTITKTP